MVQINPRAVYVLLTAHSDLSSRFFNLILNGDYTHVSIGLEDQEHLFYSFVMENGFRLERPTYTKKEHKLKNKCALFRLNVTKEQYDLISKKINWFQQHSAQYHYSFINLVLCLFKIPLRRKKGYICSQFVAELLEAVHALKLNKNRNLYLPNDFISEPELRLQYQGTIGGLAELYGHQNNELLYQGNSIPYGVHPC